MRNSLETASTAKAKADRLTSKCRQITPDLTLRPHKGSKVGRLWEIAGNFVKRAVDDNYFRVGMIEFWTGGVRESVRAVLLQESKHYNKAECDRVIGECILPVRVGQKDLVEAGLTAVATTGSYGEPVVTAPRFSNSDAEAKERLTNPDEQVIREYTLRPDPNRSTGRVQSKIVREDCRFDNYPLMEWFNEDEVKSLLDANIVEDSVTANILRELILKRAEVIAVLNED